MAGLSATATEYDLTRPPGTMTPLEYCLLFGLPYMIASTIWFVLLRDREPIKSREWGLTLLTDLVGILLFIVETVVSFDDPDVTLPCALRIFPGFAVMPAFVGGYLLRCYFIYYQYTLASERASSSRFVHWTLRHRWSISRPFLYGAYIGCITISFLVGALIFQFDPGVDRDYIETNTFTHAVQFICSNFAHMSYWIIAQAAASAFLALVATILLWQVQDTFMVKWEIKFALVIGIPCALLWIIQNTLDPWPGFAGTIWAILYVFLCNSLSNLYPVALVYIQEYRVRKARISAALPIAQLGGDNNLLSIADSRASPLAQASTTNATMPYRQLTYLLAEDAVFLESFREYCVRSWCIESLNFVLEVPRYEACRTDEERRQEALVLWQTFLARHAPQELIVSPPERENVLRRIDAGDFGKDLFDEIKDVLLTRLYEDTFWRFNAQRSFNLSSPF